MRNNITNFLFLVLITTSFSVVAKDDVIKIYDKGINVTEPEKIHQLLVKYRSGDMLAPNISPTEALKLEVNIFIDQLKSNSPDSNNDLIHGRHIVEILEASNRALKRKERVSL